MKRAVTVAVAAAALGISGLAAHAESLKIGFLATLSGPPAALGEHMRDGFLLGVKQAGGKLGGLDTEVLVVDDELKPDTPSPRRKVCWSATRSTSWSASSSRT